MRKIERQMLDAIKNGETMRQGNTAVIRFSEGLLYVVLCENILAVASTTARKIVAFPEVFERWPTATTRSRLRALGFDAHIRKGEGVIDGPTVLSY